jgi:hypothetical protein
VPLSTTNKTLFVIGIVIILTILLAQRDNILDMVLSDKFKSESGFYNVKWKSKEFEEFAGKDLIELYSDAKKMLSFFKNSANKFSDYSFIVFPLAKVYEGILKKILVEANLITEAQLQQDPDFSISGYFNPTGNSKIFDSLKDKTRDKAVPYVIFATYQECRNQILHYDPYRDNRIKNIDTARFYIERILDAIDKAYDTFKK